MASTKINIADKKAAFILITLAGLFVIMTLLQDYLRSELKNSAFYFSESFMFSSFWWLFVPFLFFQFLMVKFKINLTLIIKVAIIVLPILLHLLAFPLLVQALSSLFYYHTYVFQQTFNYTLSEHIYQLVLIYSIPFVFYTYFRKKANAEVQVPAMERSAANNFYISKIAVSDGYKKCNINVIDVVYFSANSPYINIHLDSKTFLCNETLRALNAKLNPEQFVKIHKSTIINIEMVDHYTTRFNGDYDVTMKNKTQLRVSRNFASEFKKLMSNGPHFTTK